MKVNTVTCMAYELTDVIDGDLDSKLHNGFTIGKRGKQMYWYFIWHSTGNASVFNSGYPVKRRFIRGDQLITIHFK